MHAGVWIGGLLTCITFQAFLFATVQYAGIGVTPACGFFWKKRPADFSPITTKLAKDSHAHVVGAMRFSASLAWQSKLGGKLGKCDMARAGNRLSFVTNAEDAGDGRGLDWD
jgi:hypothetical protein